MVHAPKKSSQVDGCHDWSMIGMCVNSMAKTSHGTESESYMGNEYYRSGLMSHGNDGSGPCQNTIRIEKHPLSVFSFG